MMLRWRVAVGVVSARGMGCRCSGPLTPKTVPLWAEGRFPLRQAAQAHALLARRTVQGKLLLQA